MASQESQVLAPTNGTVTHADAGRVTIYIAVSDEHSIYAPVAGHVDELRAESGEWRRPIRPDEQEPGGLSVFQAYEVRAQLPWHLRMQNATCVLLLTQKHY